MHLETLDLREELSHFEAQVSHFSTGTAALFGRRLQLAAEKGLAAPLWLMNQRGWNNEISVAVDCFVTNAPNPLRFSGLLLEELRFRRRLDKALNAHFSRNLQREIAGRAIFGRLSFLIMINCSHCPLFVFGGLRDRLKARFSSFCHAAFLEKAVQSRFHRQHRL